MPQIFRMGSYWIYFWTNESKPVEPIHVHVASGSPRENATKIWITETGKCLLCNNNSKIPMHTLRNIMRTIEARSDEVIEKWIEYFTVKIHMIRRQQVPVMVSTAMDQMLSNYE